MLVTLLGIFTSLKLSQSAKAAKPIVVTLFGIVTFIILSFPANALLPIVVTSLGTTTVLLIPLYFFNTPFSISKSVSPADTVIGSIAIIMDRITRILINLFFIWVSLIN